MLISDIEPIGEATTDLFVEESNDLIDRIIELPLRKACKLFRDKGIETIMSSANKNNVLEDGKSPTEKDDVYGTLEKLMESHYFTEAGNGYAWIMLNYNSLSDENKKMLFELEKKDERLVWFVHPFEMNGNIEYGLRSGKFTKEYLKQALGKEQIPEGIEYDPSLEEFDKRHVVLLYPWEVTTEAVMLRMPIDKTTTVEDVDDFFVKITECFKRQELNMMNGKSIK
jgi:hypothetical protein